MIWQALHPGTRTTAFVLSCGCALLPVAGYDGWSALKGQIETKAGAGYGDRRYTRAVQAPSTGRLGENSFARAWRAVAWGPGDDVWYGAAFRIPRGEAPAYAYLLRWDNYDTYASEGDVGGVELSAGRLRLFRQDYSGANYAELTPRAGLPLDRWFWLEVHQVLSPFDGLARSELYLDGRLVGQSLLANSRGREIDHLRVGLVHSEGPRAQVDFDRFTIAGTQRGPLR